MKKLDGHLEEAKTFVPVADNLKKKWSGMIHPREAITKMDTGVDIKLLKEIGSASVSYPPDITIHPRLLKHHVQGRLAKIEEGKKLDWATAESLALGSLLVEGKNVRISGQDVGRGTFSQRHVMLVDQQSEKTIIPLNVVRAKQGKLEVFISNIMDFHEV